MSNPNTGEGSNSLPEERIVKCVTCGKEDEYAAMFPSPSPAVSAIYCDKCVLKPEAWNPPLKSKHIFTCTGEFYRPRYEETFKYHPKKDEIVEKLATGNVEDDRQVDLWFSEAEYYTWQNFCKASTVDPEGK